MRVRPLHYELSVVIVGTALLLLVPLIAGRLTREVNWTLGDFAAAGALLSLAGFGVVLVRRYVAGKAARAAGVLAILLLAALVWAELAVGLLH